MWRTLLMAKVIVDYIDLGDGGMAYNYNHYTKEEAIAEYKKDYDRELNDWEPFVTWYRYKTKAEVIADGDWEIINGYEQGYMQVFEECEPNDVGAFKCWVIEN